MSNNAGGSRRKLRMIATGVTCAFVFRRDTVFIANWSLFSEPMGEFIINTEGQPFSLPYTLDSGQAFRWTEKGEWWYGVLQKGVVKLRQEGASLVCSSSSDA